MDPKNWNTLNLTLGQLFFENLIKYKKRIVQFIADTDEADTYEDLLRRSVRTALTLKTKDGIRAGDVIGLCANNHKNSCVPIIAAQFLGAINANFDFNLSHAGMVRLLQLIRPKVMFVDSDGLGYMEECLRGAGIEVKIVVFGGSERFSGFEEYLVGDEGETDFRPVAVHSNRETAMILFSSGTTGAPKGICLSHYTLLTQSVDNVLFANVSETTNVFMASSNLYWISAVLFLIKTISTGDSKVSYIKFDPTNLWRIIEKYKVNTLFLVPHLAAQFVTNRPENVDVSCLETFLIGASLVPKKLMEDLKRVLPGTTVTQGYGQTEAGGIITMFDVADAKQVEWQDKKPQSCGLIWHKFQWKVVNPVTGETLGPFQKGELRVKSDFMMNGYYKMDSSSVFDSEGYLKTGDMVYYDDDFCFFIVDRLKEMFKCRGTHIIPSMLEEVLLSHPSVKEAIVIGVPHETDEHHPMGVVVLRDENDGVTEEAIEKFVEQKVYDLQKLRAGVKIVKEIPRTPTGKILRKTVKETILN